MSDEGVDLKRRRFLTGSTAAVGAVGVGAMAWFFVKYMSKSNKAEALGAPVDVDISKLQPGQKIVVEWRSQPVWVIRRTKQMLDDLKVLRPKLKDPDSKNTDQQPPYIKGEFRSLKNEYMVAIGLCTHLGCSPKQVNKTDVHELGPDWLGGFLCACHGSKFDFAGRVYSGVPAQSNLLIPPHKYLSDTSILIGVDTEDGQDKKGAA